MNYSVITFRVSLEGSEIPFTFTNPFYNHESKLKYFPLAIPLKILGPN